ncbi:MAG: type II toxin-antitoxin system VapC family toxin [Candidatus Altiarchaeota archaeon]
MRYYVDTNVWRDFLESREDNLRPLGEYAFQFLKHAMLSKERILYSDFVVEELMVEHSAKDIEKLCFEPIKDAGLLERVELTRIQIDEAVRIARQRNVPRGDALHAVLARDNQAVCVTRDKHFELLKDIVESKMPEELI